ncbi:MAG: MATE family efflux transporter [Alistipes sp.]|nr:MATE family efflux transporter [Alistipes sp.]
MERNAIDLGTVDVPKLFRRMFLPTLFGMLSISAVTAVDGIFIGHGVGSDGIAAVNLCVPVMMVFTGLGLMMGVGCSVVAAVHLSRSQARAARINVTQALAFVSAVTVAATTLIVVFARQTALAMGSSERLLPLVVDYLQWFMPSMVFQMWVSISLFIIRLDGAPRVAMWCSVVSAALNVVLDYIFIFPLGWGVRGAAFATSLSVATGGVMALGYLLFFARTLRPERVKLSAKSMRLTARNLGYQCRIGSSTLLGELTLAMLMYVGNVTFMRYLGDDGVGAFGVACYYTPFVFMVGNAIAQSAQPILSYNYGVGNFERVWQAGRLAVRTAVVCGGVVMLVFMAVPDGLVGLFLGSGGEAARIAIDGLPYFSAGFIFFVVNLAVIGYNQSLERMAVSTSFALLRGALFLVPSFMVMPLVAGTAGIWMAMPVSEFLTTLAIVAYYGARRMRRRSA